MPRYVRVNTLSTSLAAAIRALHSDNFVEVSTSEKRPSALQRNEFLCDAHIDNLLAFAPGTDLHSHPLYCEGQLILQDKV